MKASKFPEQSPLPPGETVDLYADDTIVFSPAIIREFAAYGFNNERIFVKLSGNKAENYKIFHGLRQEFNIVTDFEYSSTVYEVEDARQKVGFTFLIIGAVSSILVVLITVSLISVNILRQKREIGILRSLGARAKDILRIYLFESLFISVIAFLGSIVLTMITIILSNALFSAATLPNVILLCLLPMTVLVLFCAAVIMINLASVIPLGKISKMKPVDAIRNT